MTSSFPLTWTEGWPRTPSDRLERGYQFKKLSDRGWRDKFVSFAEARDRLYDEIRRLGAKLPIVSTNHPSDRSGVPTESKRGVADEGVAVYFTLGHRPMVMACDRFDNAAANMRSLGLAIEAMRQLARHGGGTMMERAFTGFVALPAPDSPWDILGLKPGAPAEEVEAAFHRKAKAAHPDRPGGSHEAMTRLNDARRKLREL